MGATSHGPCALGLTTLSPCATSEMALPRFGAPRVRRCFRALGSGIRRREGSEEKPFRRLEGGSMFALRGQVRSRSKLTICWDCGGTGANRCGAARERLDPEKRRRLTAKSSVVGNNEIP